MPELPPAERTLRAQIAAHESWAQTSDRTARTAPARAGLDAKFEAMVPAEITDPAERARRADHFRKAHFARLTLRSAQVRRARKNGTTA